MPSEEKIKAHFHNLVFNSNRNLIDIAYELDALSYTPDSILDKHISTKDLYSDKELNEILMDPSNFIDGKYYRGNFNIQIYYPDNDAPYVLIHYSQRDEPVFPENTRKLLSSKGNTVSGGIAFEGAFGRIRLGRKVYLNADMISVDQSRLREWVVRKQDKKDGTALLPEQHYHSQAVPVYHRRTKHGKNSHEMHMPLVLGIDLLEFININKRLSISTKCEILYKCLLAIKEMQKEGYTHGDIKPENIMIYVDDLEIIHVKIIDKNNAVPNSTKVTSPHGTTEYLPTWTDKESKDVDTDLYSLGCTLKEMCGWAILEDKKITGFQKTFPKHERDDEIKIKLFQLAQELTNFHQNKAPNFSPKNLDYFIKKAEQLCQSGTAQVPSLLYLSVFHLYRIL